MLGTVLAHLERRGRSSAGQSGSIDGSAMTQWYRGPQDATMPRANQTQGIASSAGDRERQLTST